MNRYTIKIDSRLRNPNYPSSTNFMYQLGRNLRNINKVNLSDYYIPNTSYTVNQNNNVFSFIYNGVTSLVFLTTRNYNAIQLGQELQSRLNLIANVFTVTFDLQSNKYTIVSSAFPFSFNFSMYPLAGRLFGFPQSASSSGTTITSPNVANLSITPLYHLYIEEIPINSLIKIVPSTFTINNNVLPGAIASSRDSDIINNIYCLLRPIDVAFLTIRLYDADGYIVNLNGADFYLEIDLYAGDQ